MESNKNDQHSPELQGGNNTILQDQAENESENKVTCGFGGQTYPLGSIVCMNGYKHKCSSQDYWTNLKTPCRK